MPKPKHIGLLCRTQRDACYFQELLHNVLGPELVLDARQGHLVLANGSVIRFLANRGEQTLRGYRLDNVFYV
jgi:hypothetical protein